MIKQKSSIVLRITRTAVLIAIVSTSLGWVATEPVDEVNIFLGTDWDRRLDLTTSAQCTPAAIRPFGMISPGPFNDPYTNSGYSHAKKSLIGFNHTHLSGVGVGSYGLITLLPVTGDKGLGTVVTSPPEKRFAEPGFFKTELEEDKITAEMTCTKRAAIHRYIYPADSKNRRVLLDLSRAIFNDSKGKKPETFDGDVSLVGDRALQGVAHTTSWSEHRTWFYIECNKPFLFEKIDNKGGILQFPSGDGDTLLVKVGISYVSEKNAR